LKHPSSTECFDFLFMWCWSSIRASAGINTPGVGIDAFLYFSYLTAPDPEQTTDFWALPNKFFPIIMNHRSPFVKSKIRKEILTSARDGPVGFQEEQEGQEAPEGQEEQQAQEAQLHQQRQQQQQQQQQQPPGRCGHDRSPTGAEASFLQEVCLARRQCHVPHVAVRSDEGDPLRHQTGDVPRRRQHIL
jgi:hypothetical protein